jgi:diadenosine tetraphosphatase ApaH/serine/threonine PP2A family protein phosphatase
MRIAVFSDIHGNIEALEAFIQDVAGRRVDRHICLGDVVGYGASPGQCLERLDCLPGLGLLMGNHDAAAIWQASPYQMTPHASKAILWTMDQLSDSQADRIASLENSIRFADMTFCHANPFGTDNWGYVTTWFSAMRTFMASASRIIFVGHTHRPKVITRHSGMKIRFSDPPADGLLLLADGLRYIVNCGSVGQPRDGNADAGYVIWDTDRQEIEFVRIPYDIESAARRIEKAGLPGYLAQRLFKGR